LKGQENENDKNADNSGLGSGPSYGGCERRFHLWNSNFGAECQQLVRTDFVLNPADGPFSVFAWIKGGAPGQVILSQIGEADWLCTDASAGNLMTELEGLGRAGCPLVSQTLITDGNWHPVGLTWDGSNRILYVDDLEVAKDTQAQFSGSAEGLYIGAGKNLDAGSFFSGLIDDVRVYNRAVTP